MITFPTIFPKFAECFIEKPRIAHCVRLRSGDSPQLEAKQV